MTTKKDDLPLQLADLEKFPYAAPADCLTNLCD